MELLIKKKERIIALAIVVLLLGTITYMVLTSDSSAGSDYNYDFVKTLSFYGYFTVLVISTFSTLREFVISKRLEAEEAELYFRGHYITEALLLSVHVSCHWIFWIIYLTDMNIYVLPFLLSLCSAVYPRIVSKRIYSNIKHFFYEGSRYTFEDIESFEASDFYKVKLELKGDVIYVSTNNAKRFDSLIKLLADNVTRVG